jgi:hypothetical protein
MPRAPEHALAHNYLGMTEIHSRNAARGIARCKHALELDRCDNETYLAQREHIYDGMRKAAVPES